MTIFLKKKKVDDYRHVIKHIMINEGLSVREKSRILSTFAKENSYYKVCEMSFLSILSWTCLTLFTL